MPPKQKSSESSARLKRKVPLVLTTSVDIPDAIRPPLISLSNATILVYGKPKIGKTDLVNQFPEVLNILTERGGDAIPMRPVLVKNWVEFIDVIQRLQKRKRLNFKTLSIDTVSNLFKFCTDYVCTHRNIDHPSDLGYGKGWEALRDEFNYWITQTLSLKCGVIFVAHSKEKQIDAIVPYTQTVPTLNATAYDVINPVVDCIFYCDIEKYTDGKKTKSRRIIRTKPSKYYDAGDRTGKLPNKLPMSYTALKKAFASATESDD